MPPKRKSLASKMKNRYAPSNKARDEAKAVLLKSDQELAAKKREYEDIFIEGFNAVKSSYSKETEAEKLRKEVDLALEKSN